MKITYSWLNLYDKISLKIKEYKDNHYGLIEVLRHIGFEDLNDKDVEGDIVLDDIDPFTFLSYLNKFGDERRIYYLQMLSNYWELDEQVNDVCGLPTSNAQKVWLFPYKKDRLNNEIDRLWNLYFSVMEDKVSNEQLFDIVTISSVGWAKISEGLFYLKPDKYLPLNSVVIPYLKSLGISPVNNSYDAILTTCQNAQLKLNKPMYEISYEGWLYADRTKREPQYWRIGTSEDEDSLLVEMLSNNIVSIGWTDLGDLSLLGNKSNIQAKLKELYYKESRNNLVSRKANEIFNFYNNLKANDYVIAMDGMTVKAIARVYDQRYHYNSSLRFGHIKAVQWISKDVDGLKIDEGLRTTFVKIENKDNIEKIKQYFEGKIASDIEDNDYNNNMDMPLNQILYGPPGTGKTYNTVLKAAQIVSGDIKIDYTQGQQIFNVHLYDQIEFITFHQNYSYEDFIQGIRPDTDNDSGLSFDKKDGIFKRIADRALANLKASKEQSTEKLPFESVFNSFIAPLIDGDTAELEVKMKKSSFYITYISEKSIAFRKNIGESEHTLSIATLKRMYDKGENDIILGGLQPYYNPILALLLEKGKLSVGTVQRKNYVIVIDEINRANISRVFGELITLIEEDKRSDGDLPLTVVLPSGDKFIVPSNLYIIGTMNTADKSIALLDIALRRRFEFIPQYPDPFVSGVHDSDILQKINSEILKRKGHDFTIGHAYFMGSKYSLEKTINNKVVPLLLEYFMNDEKEVISILKAADIQLEGWPLRMKAWA